MQSQQILLVFARLKYNEILICIKPISYCEKIERGARKRRTRKEERKEKREEEGGRRRRKRESERGSREKEEKEK